MKALERLRGRARAADSKIKLRPERTLLCVRALEALGENGVVSGYASPPLYSTRGFEPRHSRDEVWAREPESGRKRLAVLVVCVLLRDRRPPVRAAQDDPTKRSRWTS
jgi:hypothetical protein